ncbi:MAG: HAD family phosphatase [Acidobacteriota bacterium]
MSPSLSSFHPAAAIFDVDGTIVDNMDWHARAFDAFARRHGLPPMTLETRRQTDGKRNREIFPVLFGREIGPEELRAFEEEKEGMYREISRSGLSPMAGFLRLLDRLDDASIPVALATSAPEANVEHTLREIGLTDRLGVIARGDQVKRGKPAPDVFLFAASLLGVPPEQCLAFEDAPLGIASARAAGMRCVAITSTFSAEDLLASDPPPDAAYADFDAYLNGVGRIFLEPGGPGE